MCCNAIFPLFLAIYSHNLHKQDVYANRQFNFITLLYNIFCICLAGMGRARLVVTEKTAFLC